MANALNQNPIEIDSPMSVSFWAALRALGVLSSTAGKPITVTSITWTDVDANSEFQIYDGFGTQPNNQLFNSATPADFVGSTLHYPFPQAKQWRDFQVTAITGGKLIIQYR